MSTDVALPVADQGSLVAWAQEARQAHQIAQSLAQTSFVPKAMQGRPDEVTGAILAGRELGMDPMASLRSIDIIDGTPAMRAHALRGLVQAHGHRIWVEESTDNRAVVCGARRTSPMGPPSATERSVWTMDRARKGGLANKRNWQTYPAAMLVARATAEVCRLIASDVLLGMPYAVEELDTDIPPGPVKAEADAGRPATARRTLRREPLGEPPPDPAPPAALEPAPAPAPDTEVPGEPEQWPDVAAPGGAA